MTFIIPGSSEFALLVNGVDMLIGVDNLKEVSIIENATSATPTVSMTFIDTRRRAVGAGAFTDGAKIQVVIGDGTNTPNTYNFLQWSLADTSANSAGEVVTVSAVANLLPWLSKVNTQPYVGSSSDVMSRLGSQYGMLTDCDPTQDSMNWLPNTKTVQQWARDVADHSWAGDGLSMMLSVTSQAGAWMLRYKDILVNATGTGPMMVSGGLAAAVPPNVIIYDYRVHSDSMFYNTWINYGYKVIQEQIDGTLSVYYSMNVPQVTSSIGIDSTLQAEVGLVRTFYFPADVGNTHMHYAQAAHHNMKAQASFTTTVHVMVPTLTPYRLLDFVSIQLAMSDGSINTAYSGSYVISGITRYISKGSYREKLVLMSQGTNASLST